ncbi:MAG: hypothetical protein QW390_01875, partial [Candidatus Bathyarchaeia archaeon]
MTAKSKVNLPSNRVLRKTLPLNIPEGVKVQLYDTTLRDGNQALGVNFSIDDKIKITRKLDEFGI